MILQVIKQANVKGVASDATPNDGIPRSGVHHGLIFVCKTAAGVPSTRAEIIAEIGKITIKLDGDIKVEATAQQLLDLYKYWNDCNGALTVAGGIPIMYTRPYLKTAAERSLLAWGLADKQSYSYEIEIGTIATISTIEVYSIVEEGNRKLGRHLCLSLNPKNFGSTGVHLEKQMDYNNPDIVILADHITEGSGTIDDVDVRVNNNSIRQNVPSNLADLVGDMAQRKTQSGYYHVDYTLTNDKSSGLPSGPVTSLSMGINFSVQPDNFYILREEVRGMLQPVV